MKSIKTFLESDLAGTSVEYAVMLALIAGACITAMIGVGIISSLFWQDSADGIGNALNN